MFASRCNCSTRALERFLWDCAGLQLRASRHHRSSFPSRPAILSVPSIRSFGGTSSLAVVAKKKRPSARSSASSPVPSTAVKAGTTKKSKPQGTKTTESPSSGNNNKPANTAPQKPVSASRLQRKERRKKDGTFKAAKSKDSSTSEQPGSVDECKQDIVKVAKDAREQQPTVVTSAATVPNLQSSSATSHKDGAQRDESSRHACQPSQTRPENDIRMAKEGRLTRRERRMAQKGAANPLPSSTLVPAKGSPESQVEDLESILSKIDVLKTGASGLSEPSVLARMENNARPRPKPQPLEQQLATPKSPKSEASRKKTVAVERDSPKPPREPWQIQKAAAKRKFGETGWSPRKRLSPDTLNGIRALHGADPAAYTPKVLANQFSISPEAIQRILRSKWRPSEDEAADRMARWERRGERKWSEMADKGLRPPRRWRATLGISSRKRHMGRRRTGAGGVKVATSAEQANHGGDFLVGVPRQWLESTTEDENAGTAFADRIA